MTYPSSKQRASCAPPRPPRGIRNVPSARPRVLTSQIDESFHRCGGIRPPLCRARAQPPCARHAAPRGRQAAPGRVKRHSARAPSGAPRAGQTALARVKQRPVRAPRGAARATRRPARAPRGAARARQAAPRARVPAPRTTRSAHMRSARRPPGAPTHCSARAATTTHLGATGLCAGCRHRVEPAGQLSLSRDRRQRLSLTRRAGAKIFGILRVTACLCCYRRALRRAAPRDMLLRTNSKIITHLLEELRNV